MRKESLGIKSALVSATGGMYSGVGGDVRHIYLISQNNTTVNTSNLNAAENVDRISVPVTPSNDKNRSAT